MVVQNLEFYSSLTSKTNKYKHKQQTYTPYLLKLLSFQLLSFLFFYKQAFQCCNFYGCVAVNLMLDSKSSNENRLSMGKLSHDTLCLLMVWDQRQSNVLPLHLIARATNQICLSVPNLPCKVHQHKNFIKQLYFFHITNFKGNKNLEENVYDIRKTHSTPKK